MPGLYLIAILVSGAGIVAIDARLSLAFWRAPVRTTVAVVIGTAFFLLWDAVGIATGVFVKGGSALLLGIDVAPQLPLEEPFFLAFLCYLALVASTWANRRLARRAGRGTATVTDTATGAAMGGATDGATDGDTP